MKVLDFALILRNDKVTTNLIAQINKILNCDLREYNGDRRTHEIVWETELFGLEIELSQHHEKDSVELRGNSEKICHYMPNDTEREFTNIDEEMLNLFKVYMPDKNWVAIN